MLEAACPDPVGAFFVFLDLLKGDAEALSELFLAHSEHRSPKANATANVYVDGVRPLLVLNHGPALTKIFNLVQTGMPKPIQMGKVEVERYGNDLGLSSLLRDPWPQRHTAD